MILKRNTRPGKNCGSAEVEQWLVFGVRVVGRQNVSVITAAMVARRASTIYETRILFTKRL
jgi:hypothetical protein